MSMQQEEGDGLVRDEKHTSLSDTPEQSSEMETINQELMNHPFNGEVNFGEGVLLPSRAY